ncbi:carboxyl-terminal processing protease [Nannocystis exedens]|uniref:Carboxyl-terminal processing protease n=1 Tax=Nannocystis exedens TaxID=54 RepID=A0A1I2DQM4_9BACT|nr:S41 family peptidase [Nannocystis exedens]PCC68981.1 putative CtpA-like serine protease [Nannocystis exedens]SFE82777.1 carboxyl-terminal processing protease [Nannocystis exedens]
MRRPLSLLTLALFACDPATDDVAEAPEEANVEAPALAEAPAPPPAEAPHKPQTEAMPDAEQAFAKARQLIAEHYVDATIDAGALYTGAVEGMLARLGPPTPHPINELLTPRQLAELLHGTGGTIVGVGVMIEQIAGVLVIRDVVPGGPAATAGLQRGDRILEIDGAAIKGKPMVEIVDQIRGPAGTGIDLFVQRDTEEWHEKLVRQTVAIPNVESKLLGDKVGYLRLRGFAETTPAEFDAGVEALQTQGAEALVLDLRACPGGLLAAAIAVTGSLLRDGQAIVTTTMRGEPAKAAAAQGDGRWKDLPLAALIGPETASGAEILADALAAHKRATLIGAPTFGKGTVESIHELGNGWAIKLSAGRFVGAGGEPLPGRGVKPHLPVPVAAEAQPDPLEAVPSEADAALAVARTWLEDQVK